MLYAVDSSSLVAYAGNVPGTDVDFLDHAIDRQMIHLPPMVVTEVLSAPQYAVLLPILKYLPMLPLQDGFWKRAAESRRAILAHKLRANTLDALIAQCCIDAGATLITRDRDFRHFAKYAGLKLA